MALTRGFSPSQFRDGALGMIGPFQVTATIPSTAAGAVGGVQVVMPTGLGLQTGDVLFIQAPVTSRVSIEVQVDDATHLSLIASNGSAGAFNPGSIVYTVVGYRPKAA
jgi:hypothetical protein